VGWPLLFDEFAGWAIQKNLDMDPSDNVFNEETLKVHGKMSPAAVTSQASKQAAAKSKKAQATWSRDIMHNMDPQLLVAKLPVRDGGLDEQKRARLFTACDSSNNGALTVSEVQTGLGTLIGKGAVRAFSVAIMSAFRAAKDLDGSVAQGASERVCRKEFHELIIYLRYYLELLFSSPD